MKFYYFLLIATLFSSCAETTKTDSSKKEINNKNQLIRPAFQSLIDSAKVVGSILIYDFQKKKYYSNNFTWANSGKLPASTFKIPNSIIAVETGVVENENTLFKWKGESRYLKAWEQDLTFRKAFQLSCVPCYQEIARKIGANKMNNYLNKLDYGDMKVESENIDIFWLQGGSRISQFQQIDFLTNLYESKLPISERTEKIIKKMMVIEDNQNYTLSGKTGLSISGKNNNGWFVGYVDTKNKLYFFATNLEPKTEASKRRLPKARKEVTYKALKQLGILK